MQDQITTKLLEENTGRTLSDILQQSFLDLFPRVMGLKTKNEQMGLLCVCVRETERKRKRESSVTYDSPGRNTGVGCYSLLHRIFLTQGWKLCLKSPTLVGRFFTIATPGKL